MTAGTNGSTCTVNGKDGIKVGTSKAGGDMTITVPSGATTLHLYAAAWKGVTGLSLNISGATTSPASIALTADDGISNNSPFTLSGTESNFKFDITLSNITSEKEIKFTSSTTKRFVVWGATYETASSGDDPTPTPSLSVSPTKIDFGTVEKGDEVNSQSVVVTYANLTGAVSYSGLSGAFSATGTISSTGDQITITPNTSTVGEYSQTLTVQSSSDNKSATVTVTMNVVEPFDGLKLTFDLSKNNLSLPVAKGSSTAGEYTYTLNEVAYKFYATDFQGSNEGGIYFSTSYTMIYASNALGLPSIQGYKLVKVEASNSSGCSTATQVSIKVGSTANDQYVTGGAAQKWSTTSSTYTYTLSNTEDNTRYYVYVASKNCQMTGLVLYYEEVEAPAIEKPIIAGETPFLTSTTVTLIQADADHIYYTTNGDAPTTSSTEYNASFELNATTTVKAIAVKGSDVSDVAEKTFTKVTVMTVPEAKAAIDAAGSTPIENQYVTGIISQIDSYNSTYHSIQYWISADGTTTDQLEVYSGKGLNGADFAGISDLSLGDEVIVKGTLKKYSSTYEFDMNSQIVQLNRTIAAPTFTPNGGGFLTTLNVSLASATEGAEVRYTTDGSDPTSTSTLYENSIELSSTTTIKAAAFKGEFVSVIVTKTFTKGTKIAVAAALDALNSSSPIADQFVYGKISTAPTSNPNSGRLTYKISDDGTTTDELEVYNGFGLNGAEFSDKTDLQVGDEVTVYGTLKIYNEKKEFDAGNYLLEFNRPEVQTYSITYEENGGAEVADVAEATNLPDPLPTTTKDDKAFGGWFTDAEFNTPAVAGAALTSNVTLYAKWNDVSAWAAVYTSNVEIASDVAVHVTINESSYDAAKANKGGSAAITLPQGVTTIHLHLVAWNGEGQTVTISGDCFDEDKSLAIEANTNVSGSGTTYDLGASGVDYYFSLTPDNEVSEGEVITITAASGKRFVLFGVNQEGGAIPASIAVNQTSLAFGSVEQDAEVEAKTINVTLTEVAAATVTLAGDGASAFSIDKEALNASGIITVTPNTANVGTYAATITISDNASEAESVEVAVSMTVTEPVVADDLSGTWALVTDASQLVAGKKVIIAEAVESDGEAKTMGVQNNNNRAAVVSTVASGILTPNVATKTFTLADAGNSKWALQGTDSKYLYAASSNSNYLKSQDEIDDNATWTIGIENSKAAITANGTNTRNIIRFNSSSSLFSCYASGQNDIALYIQQQEDTPIDPEQSFEDVRTGLEIGRHYTICMPKKIVAIDGATFWGINNCDEGKTSVYLEMQQPPFEAGTPFIFYATATTLKVAYEGEETATPIENGALHGTFVDMDHAALEAAGNQVYLMYQNALHPLGTNNHLDANRAYLLFEELVPGTPAPGRQVKRMPMHTNITTGIENIEASDRPTKMLIDGKMFIRCSEKLYDATGSLVK